MPWASYPLFDFALYPATVVRQLRGRDLGILGLGLSLLSCSEGSVDVAEGDEGGACYRNGTCNGEWVCLSGLCVEDEPGRQVGANGEGRESSTGGADGADESSATGGSRPSSSTGGSHQGSGGSAATGGAANGAAGGEASTGGNEGSGGAPGTGGSPGTNLIVNNAFMNDAEGWTSAPETYSIRTTISPGSYCIYNPNTAVESVHFQYPNSISKWFPLKMGGQYRLSFEAVGHAQGTISIDEHEFELSIADGSKATIINEEFTNIPFVDATPVVFRFEIPAMDDLYEYGICFRFVNLWEK